MPSAKQARRNNIALANTARFSRSASAPPPAVRAVDAGALDEANLSQAGTARAARRLRFGHVHHAQPRKAQVGATAPRHAFPR